MAKKIEISPESVLEKFSTPKKEDHFPHLDLPTSQISDALKSITCENGVIHGIKPVKNNIKVMGRAVTVKTDPEDWGTALKGIDAAQEGDVLFIDAENGYDAVWGELTSSSSQEKGIAGTVVYGAVRDVEAVRNLNYPVYSCRIVPCAGEPKGEGEINIPLECEGVKVKPGDWIIGDDCGVVVVPAKCFKEVIEAASNIKDKETRIIRRLKDGWSLSEILGIK
ncbi:RraA family protein [Methanobacterium petrolearium]|uniref:RraA family protein n=1 Tax=Methanobacterium petrolearium TaxID=710190 RepID=UPI001AE33E26|nr:RraA family protein [Methanobacterium petrolearium]MBP1946344.1 3-hexulose-6-phosphate synthase [Methanobacterium petrolearium]BDZ70637.1 hypothetical protein GCM10025861_11540 [Methanobacterium petrolearium]